MRIGIFGGSFDPVHNGHLALAGACQDQAALDQVWFTPAAQQPLKPGGPVADAEHRARMIELAIGDHNAFRLSRIELDRGGVSYTIDTLREIQKARPGDKLFLLLGADAMADLPNWYQPQEILQLATPLVVPRGEPTSVGAEQTIEMPPIEISSSDIRRRVAVAEAIDALVPAAAVA